MKVKSWLVGVPLVVATVVVVACGGEDDQKIIDELCAKWEQCFPDQGLGFCIFEEAYDSCSNSDEFVDHFETCRSMTCDQLTFDCIMGFPRCDESPTGSPSLPWLPRDDDQYTVDSPPVPGSNP